jgi:hypothetical protein
MRNGRELPVTCREVAMKSFSKLSARRSTYFEPHPSLEVYALFATLVLAGAVALAIGMLVIK